MGFAQNLIDELEYEDYVDKFEHEEKIEKEVEEELSVAIEQEMSGKLSHYCAQRLIDSV